MLDETILTETPPLYCCYGRIGQQVSVPITGSHKRRILHGALNVGSGDVVLEITEEWNQVTHRAFLSRVRAHWRGWNLVLFEDRAGQHTAPDSLWWADCLGIEIRLLPRAAPGWDAAERPCKQAKRDALGGRPTADSEQSAAGAGGRLLATRPRDRLRQAGVSSGNFWLTK